MVMVAEKEKPLASGITRTRTVVRQANAFKRSAVCHSSLPVAITSFLSPFAAAEVCGRVVTVIVASVNFAVPSRNDEDGY